MEPSEISYNRDLWLRLFETTNQKLRMTDVGVYSITHPYMAMQFVVSIMAIVRDIGVQAKTATDSTGGLGGMSRYICIFFEKLTVVEKNSLHFDICKSNLQILSGGRNITFVKLSFLEYMEKMPPQDMIFCDPPWGGSIYKSQTHNSLYLDGKNVCDIINVVFSRGICKVFALMAMINYNFDDLDMINPDITYKVGNVRNVYLICFYKK